MTQNSNGTLYVGKGEFACEEGEFMGTGIYRSTDGMNFSVIPGTQPLFNDPLSNWAYIVKMANDPNSGRLFAATNNGIKYSDNGDTWTDLMLGTAIDVVVGANGTVVFVVDNHVYVAAGGDLSNPVDVSTGDADKLPLDDAGWTDLAISPSDPNVMYASIAKESDDFLLGVYSSEDGGTTWSLIFPPNPTFDPFRGKNTRRQDIMTGSRYLPDFLVLFLLFTMIMHSVPTIPQSSPSQLQMGSLQEHTVRMDLNIRQVIKTW